MKRKALLLVATITVCGFAYGQDSIGKCYTSFKGTKEYTVAKNERMPANLVKNWSIPTDSGKLEMSRVDEYRISYQNNKGGEFALVKIMESAKGHYGLDTLRELQYLGHANSAAKTKMQTTGKELLTLRYNNYVIYGLSRDTIGTENILGQFAIFPGNNISVYFTFFNLPADKGAFKSVGDYKGIRNGFIGSYTYELNECTGKGFQK